MLSACREPFMPSGAVPWEPPAAQIDSLWQANATCSGYGGGDWRRITAWYLVPGYTFQTSTGPVSGRWDGQHTIYLADRNGRGPSPETIRHELLHVRIGDARHTNPVWVTCLLWFPESYQM